MNEQAQIALAAQLDAAGRHQEALNTLGAAANAGGLRARMILGLRLLMGDRAPHAPQDGLRILRDTAGADAETARVMAIVCAAGVFCRQDWPAALDHLRRAAELGQPQAREVLGVLTADAALGAEAGDPDAAPGIWRRMRAGIDHRALTAAPQGRDLSGDPLIRAYSDFASPRLCAWLIERARGRLSRAEVYDAVSQQVTTNRTRTNTAAKFGLWEADLAQLALQTRIAAATGAPLSHLEAPTVLHYDIGEEITEHFDFIDPRLPDHDAQVARDGQRVVTFLVYLNDSYEGGETDFPRLDVSYKGATGDAMFFVNAHPGGKADVRTVHAGRPPRAGEKWIVSQFIRSRPSLPGGQSPGLFDGPGPR